MARSACHVSGPVRAGRQFDFARFLADALGLNTKHTASRRFHGSPVRPAAASKMLAGAKTRASRPDELFTGAGPRNTNRFRARAPPIWRRPGQSSFQETINKGATCRRCNASQLRSDSGREASRDVTHAWPGAHSLPAGAKQNLKSLPAPSQGARPRGSLLGASSARVAAPAGR